MKFLKVTSALLAVITFFALSACSGGKTAEPADTGESPETTVSEQQNPTEEKKEKTYAVDSLLTDGKLGNNDDGVLTVGFIGGSLTAIVSQMTYYDAVGTQVSCGNSWGIDICHYLEDKFPNKTVKGYNAGIGGTTSDYGALRFEKSILSYEPDIVFIDYSVNDCGRSKELHQKFMERMLNMCRNAEKVPVVVFLHMPFPTAKDSEQYTKWKTGVDYKNEIADYYGIGSVNIYDYLYRKFEESSYENINDFLAQYYNGSKTFDVHGGYDLYYEAIVEKFENNPDEYFVRIGNPEETVYPLADCDYLYVAPNDERLKYEGSWFMCDRSNIYDRSQDEVLPHELTYPFAVDGIMESMSVGDSVTITTDAAELQYLTMYAVTGGVSEVTVDGSPAETVFAQNVQTVLLPDDGKTHEVKISVAESEDGARLRIGYFCEVRHTEK